MVTIFSVLVSSSETWPDRADAPQAHLYYKLIVQRKSIVMELGYAYDGQQKGLSTGADFQILI